MKANQRRKLDKFERERRFMIDNAADFPSGSPGRKATAVHISIIEEVESLAARQRSGIDDSRQHTSVKDDHLDDLIEIIRDMNRVANAFADEVPGIEQKFRLPRSRSEKNYLITAQSYLTDAEALKAKFIEFGMDAEFLDDLQAAMLAVKGKGSDADSAVESQSAATGGLLDAIQRGMANSRKLDAIIKIKYRSNPAMLAAWAVASHLEREPRSAVPVTPPQ